MSFFPSGDASEIVFGAPSSVTFGASSAIDVTSVASGSGKMTSPKRAAMRSVALSASGQRATTFPPPSSTNGTSFFPSVTTSLRPRGELAAKREERSARKRELSVDGATSLFLMEIFRRPHSDERSSTYERPTGATPPRATRTSAPSITENACDPPSASERDGERDREDVREARDARRLRRRSHRVEAPRADARREDARAPATSKSTRLSARLRRRAA